MTTPILPTQNTEWGFFGTVSRIEHDPTIDVAKAWEIASRAIAAATGSSAPAVRDFLDGRHGRHFADDVATAIWAGEAPAAAIEGAVNTWMEWTIGRSTARDWGIPRGLPYLAGFVGHYGILAESSD